MDYKKLTGDILADSKENSKRIESNLSYAKYLASKSAYDKDVSEMYGILRNSERKKMKNIENSANLQSALASMSDKTDIVESSLLMQYITSSVDFDFSMTETSYMLKGSLVLKNELAGVSWRGKVLGADIEIDITGEATEDAEGVSVNNESFRVTKICNSKTAIDEVTLEFEFEIPQDEILGSDVILKITPFIEEDETIYFFDEVKEINLRETIALKYYNDKNAPLPNLSDWVIRDATEREMQLAIETNQDYQGFSRKIVKTIFYNGSSSEVSIPIEPFGTRYIFLGLARGESSIKKVFLPEGMDYLWCYAFTSHEAEEEQYNHSLAWVSLPSTIKRIGSAAFDGCIALEEVVIKDGLEAIEDSVFVNCYNLKSIHIPDSVTSIGHMAFAFCYSLKSIHIPDSVTSIGYMAFAGCENLGDIVLSNNLQEIGFFVFASTAYALNENNWDSDGIMCIGNALVQGNDKTRIEKEEGTELWHIYVTPVDLGVTNLLIKDGIEIIADAPFFARRDLSSITFPSSVKYLGGQFSEQVDGLSNIDLNNGLLTIGDAAFADSYPGTKGEIRTIRIPDSVIHIGDGVFYQNKSLQDVIFGSGCSRLPAYTFSGCSSLSLLTIPEGITTIGSNAFEKSGIKTLFLPSSLVKIEPNVFPISEGDFPEGLTIVYNGTLAEWQTISVDKNNDGLTNGDIKIVTNTGELPENSSVRYTYNYDAKTAIIEPIEEGGTLSMSAFISSQCSIKALNPTTLYIKGFSSIAIETDSLADCENLSYIILQDIPAITELNIPEYISVFYDGDIDDIDDIETTEQIKEKIHPLRGTLSGLNSNINYDYSPFDKSVILSKGTASSSVLYEIGADELPCSEVEVIKIKEGISGINEFALKNFTKFNETDSSKKVSCELIIPDSMYADLLVYDSTPYSLLNNIGYFFGTTKEDYSSGQPDDYIPCRDDIVVYYDNHTNPTRSIYDTTYFPANYGFHSMIDRVVNGISWQYDFQSSSLKIGADIIEGAASDSTTRFGEELNIARRRIFADEDGIESIEMSDSITSISAYAFAEMEDLVSIHLPDYTSSKTGLFEIPEGCFSECINLETVNIPRNVTIIRDEAFYDCQSLLFRTSQNEPNPNFIYRDANGNGNLREVGNSAFCGCYSIEAISLPEGLLTMEEFAFDMYDESLLFDSQCKSLSIPSTLINIPLSAFRLFVCLENLEIRNGVRTIGACAFQSMSSELSEDVSVSIVIPDSVTEIGSAAFEGALRISDVKMSANVKEIGTEVFYNCESLKNFYADSSNAGRGLCLDGMIETVGENAFNFCTAVSSITIGSTVRVLSNSCFYGIKEISNLVIPNSVQEIGAAIISPDTKITSITIPFLGPNCENGAEATFSYIAEQPWLLAENTYLKHIIITPPANKTLHIPAAAFGGFKKVESITLNSGGVYGTITSIGEGAFALCSSLTSLTIPTSVNAIGSYIKNCVGILAGCTSLASLSVPFIGNARHTDSSAETATQKITYFFYGLDSGRSIDGTIADMNEGYPAFKNLTVYDYVPQEACCEADIQTLTLRKSNGSPNITIKKKAFYRCGNLQNLNIDSGIIDVEESAFDCDGLESGGITTVNLSTIYSGSSIGKFAFRNQKCMSSFCRSYYSNMYTYINFGYGAFYNCSSLSAFASTAVYSSQNQVYYLSASSIGERAFCECSSLKGVYLTLSGQTNIPTYAFFDCRSITKFYLPQGKISSIGLSAFQGCSGLTEISFPESIETIGESAFEGCSNLMLVEFNNKYDSSTASYTGVKTIGEKAFKNCRKLCYIFDMGKTVFPDCKHYFTNNNYSKTSRFSTQETQYNPNTGYNEPTIYYYHDVNKNAYYNNAIVVSNINSNSASNIRAVYLHDSFPVKMCLPLGITEIKSEAFMHCASYPVTASDDVNIYSKSFYSFLNMAPSQTFSNSTLTKKRDVWLFVPNTINQPGKIGDGAFSGMTHITKIRYCDPNDTDSRYCTPYYDGYMHESLYENLDYATGHSSSSNNYNYANYYYARKKLIAYLESAQSSDTLVPTGYSGGQQYLEQIGSKSISIHNMRSFVFSYNQFAHNTLTIQTNAFYECDSLKEVHMHKSVLFSSGVIFRSCPDLETFEFNQASKHNNYYIDTKERLYAMFGGASGSSTASSLTSLILLDPKNTNGSDSISVVIKKIIDNTNITSLSLGSTSSDLYSNGTYCLTSETLNKSNGGAIKEIYINFYNSYNSSYARYNYSPCYIDSSMLKTYKSSLKVVKIGRGLEKSAYPANGNTGLAPCEQAIKGTNAFASEFSNSETAPFRGSISLKKVYLSAYYGTSYNATTSNAYTIINSIPENTFRSCSNIETVIFGSIGSVVPIGSNAFRDCAKLQSVNSETSGQICSMDIGNYAFYSAFSSSDAQTIGLAFSNSGNLSVGESAFKDVSRLGGSLYISNTSATVTINDYAFAGTNISRIYLNVKQITIGVSAFSKFIHSGAQEGCNFTINGAASYGVYLYANNGTTTIQDYAFAFCNFDFPSSAISDCYYELYAYGSSDITLGEYAFCGCKFNTPYSQYSVFLSTNGQKHVGKYCFSGCVFNGSNNAYTDSANLNIYNIPICFQAGNTTISDKAFSGVVFTNKTRALQSNLASSNVYMYKAVAIYITGTLNGVVNDIFTGCAGNFCIKIGGISAYPQDATSVWAKLTGHKYGDLAYGTPTQGLTEYAGATNPISIRGDSVIYNSSSSTTSINFFPPLS